MIVAAARRPAVVVVALVASLAACGRGDEAAPARSEPVVAPVATTTTTTTTIGPTPMPTPPPTTAASPSTTPPLAPTTTATSSTIAPTTVPPTLPPDPATLPAPVAIAAPTIGMTSGLDHVGLQADDGGVEVPSDFGRAGWYRFGGRPGAPGPTVFVGHVDSRTGPAVFYGLRDLRPGDPVDVTLEDGSVARYTVWTTEQFPKDEFPTFAVFGQTGDDVVRLITCTGDFDRAARSYDDNLVVTAHRTG